MTIGAVLLILAATQDAPAKPVQKEIAKATTLYASAQGFTECITASIAVDKKMMSIPGAITMSEARKKQLGLGIPQVCIDNEIAKLPVGTTVDVSSNPGVCETGSGMSRVRVTSGKDKDSIGCVLKLDLRDPVPF